MPAPQSPSVLRFENVSLSFGDQPALQNVSFEVRAGDTRVIFGAAGSGKSVTLKTAMGLLHPNSGRVFLFGQDITDMDEERLFEQRAKIGVLFQEGGLFDSLTIDENVSYPLRYQRSRAGKLSPEEIEQRVRQALRFVELEHTLDKYPSELSGGMRRRVGIARAMVTEPPFMLYDSPTAGLDPITANTIMALIVKARDSKNTTSILVTHRYQDGQLLANYVYHPKTGQLKAVRKEDSVHPTVFMVFQAGHLVFEGTEEELQASTDPYVSKFKAPVLV
ncbi:MAG TPA: ATP-binding cassette domain-containing protein [Bryobacteraceae bacterium]|jgi:phospholipid/cholesterol/gamma-HCH transport system ATP-binding protein|nr:ATP-binding cassette domain-containing protein [Bryobacteraceae bacterium]